MDSLGVSANGSYSLAVNSESLASLLNKRDFFEDFSGHENSHFWLDSFEEILVNLLLV